MQPTAQQIEQFKQAVIKAASNPSFIHHAWFVKYHLEIVEQIAAELLLVYPQADSATVRVMVWLHDYGKIIDFDNQYEKTTTAGREKLLELGFSANFTNKVIEYTAILDKKLELDLKQAPIEVQITSSADGCSHFIGPFMNLWWYENSHKPFTELMQDNRKKANKDWNHKIVLPEARKAFEKYYRHLMEQTGDFPDKYFNS